MFWEKCSAITSWDRPRSQDSKSENILGTFCTSTLQTKYYPVPLVSHVSKSQDLPIITFLRKYCELLTCGTIGTCSTSFGVRHPQDIEVHNFVAPYCAENVLRTFCTFLSVRALFEHFVLAGKKCWEKSAQKVLINMTDRKDVTPPPRIIGCRRPSSLGRDPVRDQKENHNN